jgi:hypothetical protein
MGGLHRVLGGSDIHGYDMNGQVSYNACQIKVIFI